MKLAISTALIGVLPFMAMAQDAQTNAVNVITAFEDVFGFTEGKRRNHTKGFCIVGTLTPQDAEIQTLSRSPLFTDQSTVLGRVSHKGGHANPSDAKFGHYGLALEISTDDGDFHQMSMNTEHFFPVSTPEDFTALMQAKAKGAEAVKAFAANSPELRAHKAYHSEIDKSLRPYEGATYNSINSFYLVDADDNRTPVRWSFVPAGEQEIVLDPSEDFFFENMQTNLSKGSVSWDMIVTVANSDDAVDNPAIMWTGAHETITAATLEVTSISREADGQCADISFDPNVVSDGFEPSDDPVLAARSIIYSIALSKRLGELE